MDVALTLSTSCKIARNIDPDCELLTTIPMHDTGNYVTSSTQCVASLVT